MTKFEKAIRDKEESLNQRMTRKNIKDANKVLPVLNAWEKLNEEYSQLTEKVYGERRRGRFTSLNETLLAIEELKDRLENPDKYKETPKPTVKDVEAELDKIAKALNIKSQYNSRSKNVKG